MATSLLTEPAKEAARYNPTKKVRDICLDPEANPRAVREVLDAATGREWLDWEPETIRDFVGIPAADQQPLDKIMAVQVATTNADVFEEWALFNHVCTAFNHRRCNFNWLDKPALHEVAWACVCLSRLNGGHQLGPGVIRYIIALMLTEGLTYFPWSGGDGIHLCKDPYQGMTKGLVEPELCRVGDEVEARWKRGELQDLEPDDVNPKSPLEVQLQIVVNCQAYVRAQGPTSLGAL